MSNLKAEFIKGVFWTIVEKIAVLGVGFIVTIILARKLMPSDYGMIGMLSIFSVLSMVIVDGGFGQALIQKKDISSKDCSSVFYFNVLLGLLIYGLMYSIAPLIAQFYRIPELVDISRVVFLLIPLNSLSVVPQNLLVKDLKIKSMTLVTFLASLLSGIVGIILAELNYGVWALVVQMLTVHGLIAILSFVVSGWYPKIEFSIYSIKSIFKFSMSLLGVHSLAAIFQNIYTVIIGRFFNVSDVGYYNQAERINSVPSGTIIGIIQRMLFPTFSKIQNDISLLRSTYIKIIKISMFINFPLMIGFLIMGNNIFIVILTDKWLPAVPYFQLLCIASSIYPLHTINVIVLKSLGLGKKYFAVEMIKRILMIVFIVITIRYSIFLLLVGSISATIISIFINMNICGKVINISVGSQLKMLLPIFGATIFMSIAIFCISLIGLDPLFMLLSQIITAIISYIGIAYVFKMNQITEFLNIIKSRKICG